MSLAAKDGYELNEMERKWPPPRIQNLRCIDHPDHPPRTNYHDLMPFLCTPELLLLLLLFMCLTVDGGLLPQRYGGCGAYHP